MARSGGALLVAALEAQGVRTVFGVPGESYLAVLDALHDSPIRFVTCRQEGGAAFMAEAWGKLTGQPGICFVTRGPGATNASIGVHTAMQGSTPMILFVGQVARDMRGREGFQEVNHAQVFDGLAKWAVEVDRADRLPELIARAWAVAVSGRPGPVVMALPEDMLTEKSAAEPVAGPIPAVWPGVDAQAVARTAATLARAERPLALIGGGGWDAEGRQPGRTGVAAFVEAAAAAGIPVTTAFRRNDLIDNASPAWIGDAGLGTAAGVKRALAETDCLLAVNERFGEITTDGYTTLRPPRMRAPLIHVHPSADELGKVFQGSDHIQAAPDALLAALARHDLGGPGRGDWMAGLRRDYEASLEPPEQTGPVDMRAVMRHLREALPRDAIVTNGAGNFAIWPGKQLPFRPGQRWLAPQAGAMGAGLPAAVAAKIARPEATVVCFAGDGDLQMTMTELGTALQHDARPIVLLLNNASYGTIRMHQEREYPGRVTATDIVNPDFCAIARAYGMLGERLGRTEDFAPAFERAVASPTGALIVIPIPAEQITPARRLSEIRGG